MLIGGWFPCPGGCGAKRRNSEMGTDCLVCARIKKEKEEFDAKYPTVYETVLIDPDSSFAKIGFVGTCSRLVTDGNETYLREKGWQHIHTENGKDLGWWHETLTGMRKKYLLIFEAVEVQKQFDRDMKRKY